MNLRFSGVSVAALLGAGLLLAACGSAPTTSRAIRSAADALAERRYAESAVLFEQARAEAKTAEERGRAEYGLAEVAYAQAQYEPALPLYQAVIGDTALPAQLRLGAREGLGRTLRALGRKREAVEALQGFFQAQRQLTGVDKMGMRNQDPMVPPLARLEAQAGYQLGVTYYELGELEPAATVLEQIVAALPAGLNQAQAYRILAHARRTDGRLQEAADLLGRAYVVAPGEPPQLRCDLLEVQAEIYAELDRKLEAIEALGRAGRMCPGNAKLGEMADAFIGKLTAEELQSVVSRYPHEPPGDLAALYQGRALADQGDLKGAMDRLQQASAAYANSALMPRYAEEVKNLEQRLVVDPRALGFVGPLSGRLGPVGREILSGAQLAIDEYNKLHPGDAFRLLTMDSAAGVEADQSALQALAQDSRVIAVIGPVTTASLQACAPLIEQLGVPTITPSATGEALAGERKFLFRAGLLQSQQVRRIVDFAARSLNLRRFAILYPETKYGLSVRAEFLQAVQTYGGVVVAEGSYPANAADFAGPIRQVRAGAPEALFLPGDATTVALIAPQLAFHELAATLLGTNSLNTEEVARIGGKHVEGMYFVDDYFEGTGEPLAQAFLDQYRQSYGRAPSRLAAQGFDTARLLIIKILEDGNRANRSLLARKLAATANFQSVTGLSGFAPNGESVKELKVLGIQGGQIVQVQ